MEKTMSRFREIAAILNRSFLHKEEMIRLLIITTIAGEHAVLIGPPGTAKSALIRMFSELLDTRYFEYLLTRFTEPNELFGPVDIKAFREGTYRRRTEGMLPESEIVFCDEIFKANSAILNALLTILNERKFANGNLQVEVPLLSMFGASNEIPHDESLNAIYDRFLLRIYSDNLEGFHFQSLLEKGIEYERRRMTGRQSDAPILNSDALRELQKSLPEYLNFSHDFLSQYKNIVFQIRNEGISFSDRRAIKMLKLFAASALFDGREVANPSDFMILKHVWNSLDQRDLLNEIINPVLERYYEQHPHLQSTETSLIDLNLLAEELRHIEKMLAESHSISDIQLFSQLRSLNDIKQALLLHGSSAATELRDRVERLLESLLDSSKFDHLF